jgi:hypothetical protein
VRVSVSLLHNGDEYDADACSFADDDADSPHKRKRSSLGAGIVGFWKGGFW